MIGIEPRVEVGDPHPVLFGLSTGGAGSELLVAGLSKAGGRERLPMETTWLIMTSSFGNNVAAALDSSIVPG